MDQIPVAGRAAEAKRADLLLPAGVVQGIGGAPAQDQSFRHIEGRKTGVEMVKPAPDHGRFDFAGLGAEALMVPVAPFQGAVNEESEDGRECLPGFCSGSRCLQCSCIHSFGQCSFAFLGYEAEFAVFDGPHILVADGEHGHGRHL